MVISLRTRTSRKGVLMKQITMTKDVFLRNKETFKQFYGFGQNVEELVRLAIQAPGPVCTIATAPFSQMHKQNFLAQLSEHGWTVTIGSGELHDGGKTYVYNTFEVRCIRAKIAVTN